MCTSSRVGTCRCAVAPAALPCGLVRLAVGPSGCGGLGATGTATLLLLLLFMGVRAQLLRRPRAGAAA
jgi:hypothetical protein